MKSCAVIERNSATPLAAEAGGAVLSQYSWDLLQGLLDAGLMSR